ncbi:DUF4231 domain-containing protein [Nocardioides ungokensis]
MADSGSRELVNSVWQHQSVWSTTADALKARIDRLRLVMLALGIASAALTTLAAEVSSLSEVSGKVLLLAAGISVGLVPVVRARLGADAVSRWTRARAVAEELKSQVYRFLAGVEPFRGPDPEAVLATRSHAVQDTAADLLVDTAGVAPATREVPAVADVSSYVSLRLLPQVRWYENRSGQLAGWLARARRAELVLSVVGVVLAATAATFRLDVAAWVAVVTTMTAALSSHVAASRWEYQLVEYLRTAGELSRLHEEWAGADTSDEASADVLVDRCEQVISVQNKGWMARWSADKT